MRRVTVPQIVEADTRQITVLDQSHPFVSEAPRLYRATFIGGDNKGLTVLSQSKVLHFLGLSLSPGG